MIQSILSTHETDDSDILMPSDDLKYIGYRETVKMMMQLIYVIS